MKNLTRSSVVLAAAAAGLAVATAAAAVLPGAASDTAREQTAEVTVPGPNAAAGTHPAGTGEAPEAVTEKTAAKAAAAEEPAKADNHGATVSELAKTTTLTGADKGAAVAAVASDGRSTARGQSGERAADGQAKAAAAKSTGAGKAAAGKARRP